MKPAVNPSLTRYSYSQVAAARAAWWSFRLPNYVWLAMLLAAASALSFSTLARARAEAQSARLSYAQTEGRLRQAQTENVRLQVEIKELRENPRTAERLAQDRLNYVRPNEIVISVR